MLKMIAIFIITLFSWHFTHTRKAHVWLHHFTRRQFEFGPIDKFNPTTFHWSASTRPGKCTYVLKVSTLLHCTIVLLDFRMNPTVGYFILLFILYASVINIFSRDSVNYFIYLYYNAMQEQQFVSWEQIRFWYFNK